MTVKAEKQDASACGITWLKTWININIKITMEDEISSEQTNLHNKAKSAVPCHRGNSEEAEIDGFGPWAGPPSRNLPEV